MQVVLPDTDLSALILRPTGSVDDEYFEWLCAANPDLRLERTAEGEILITAPAGGETGYRNSEISGQLREWARQDGRGFAFDSSTGFALQTGARRSPNDRLADVEAKMDEWMRAGAALGWLIDPEDRRVSIYSPHSPVRVLLQAAQVQGEGLITGFVLQLEEIWKGL